MHYGLNYFLRPRGAAAAGGVRGVVNEAKPEEDAAPRGEEGAPGLRLPGRGGPQGHCAVDGGEAVSLVHRPS